MSRKTTQCLRIQDYMREHGSITPMEAFEKLHCTKLATRIGEMIRAGIGISKQMVTETDENGNTVRYMRYRLVA